MTATPHIRLDGAPNTRDLGGLRTRDGFRVRTGILFRSGELSRLTDDDLVVVNDLKLKTVVDFRPGNEVSSDGASGDANPSGADRLPDGVDTVWAPVGGGSLDEFYTMAVTGDWELAHRMLGEGRAEQVMSRVYRKFVSSDADRDGFAKALRTITDTDTLPLLFHCSAGKDRAGWLSAVVLKLLGVADDIIIDDFVQSNDFILPIADKLLSSLNLPEGKAELFRPLLSQQPSYLEAGFEEAEKRYGSFEGFVHKGLNVTPEAVEELRDRLLEPDPA